MFFHLNETDRCLDTGILKGYCLTHQCLRDSLLTLPPEIIAGTPQPVEEHSITATMETPPRYSPTLHPRGLYVYGVWGGVLSPIPLFICEWNSHVICISAPAPTASLFGVCLCSQPPPGTAGLSPAAGKRLAVVEGRAAWPTVFAARVCQSLGPRRKDGKGLGSGGRRL